MSSFIRKKLPLGLLAAFIIIYYIFLANLSGGDITSPSAQNYYNYLAQSLLHHRVDVTPENKFDLSLYRNHYFLYWGPPPVLFVLPFYLLWGLGASDTLYTLIAGLLNILFFTLSSFEALKYFRIKSGGRIVFVSTLSFALASLNLHLSTQEVGVWQTNQVVSILYLLIFFYLYFKFLNQEKIYLLTFAVVFLNLAWFSRNSLVFNLLFILYPIYLFLSKKKLALLIKAAFISLFITATTFVAYFAYNYVRFLDIFETGLRYQLAAPLYTQALRSGQALSLAHVLSNLASYFFSFPSISLNPPSIIFNKSIGSSVFVSYPYLLMFMLLPTVKLTAKQRLFFIVSLLVVLFNLTVLFLYFPLYWMKANNRYFFDVTPILFLSTVYLFQRSFYLPYLLLFLGIILNLASILGFF